MGRAAAQAAARVHAPFIRSAALPWTTLFTL